ncbi:Hpt domain-containing protein [Vibrio tasmaniensis]|uniref:Hpt domain-containing protein n=1 Tax=Vibrio tasmaniensis TaxID=212663 RepID=UPI001436856B|nr:Hpt domain-containing protein [Vibrio tasmaniensis]
MKKPNEDTCVIDYNEVLKRFDDDEHLTLNIIELFFNLTPSEIEEYRSGIKQKNIDKIKNHAHKIKSRLQFLGCFKAAQTFESIEYAAEDGVINWSQISLSMEQLEQLISSAELILKLRLTNE